MRAWRETKPATLKPKGKTMAHMRTTEAAKAIRKELKAAFPGIKFRVRSHTYSGGSSIDVNWINGPTEKQVAGYTAKYTNGHFDGMTDCYEYANDGRPGGAGYVFTKREYSDSVRKGSRAYLASYYQQWESMTEYEQDGRLYEHLTSLLIG